MTPDSSRRRALDLFGTGLAVGLAGCLGGGTGDEGAPDDEGEPTTSPPESGETTAPDEASPTGGDGTTPTDGSDGTPSGATTPFTLRFITYGDTFESLVLSVGSVTLHPASADGEAATFDAGGATVQLANLEGEKSEPALEEVPASVGTYDAVTLEASVTEATLTDGSSAEVTADGLEQSLVINDEPAELTTDWQARLSLYAGASGDGPYDLTVSGWQGTGM